MAGPVLYTRVRGGYYPGSASSSGVPAVNAAGVAPPPFAGQAYMVYPAGQGDLIWQGGVFGLSAPDSGGLTANVWQADVTVTHAVSDLAAFTQVTCQIYDTASSTVIASAPFTLSATFITETFTWTGGYPAADVPDLAVRLVWHQAAVGYANVQHAYAEISWSYSDSAGMAVIDPGAVMDAPGVSVAVLPAVDLVAAGTVATTLTPAFGQATTAGHLLLAWVYSNGSSTSFSTACSDPSWTLAGHAGAQYGWESLWYKPDCGTAEAAPSFTDPGNSVPLSQLLEFSGVRALDQAAAGTGTPDATYTAPGPDTGSGDLIFAFCAWQGTNAGPAAVTMTGEDSSGAALPLNVAADTAGISRGGGTFQFWAAGWAQAGPVAGPGAATVTASLGVYAGGGGVMASFRLLAPPQYALVTLGG